MGINVSTPKGMRDFSPIQMKRRNYLFNTIIKYYKQYGFEQIETPSVEKLSTLNGKYGEEGDKLMFKILNSGNYLKSIDKIPEDKIPTYSLTSKIAEKALKYDLTVPFARYVVQNKNDITFPFKRYQIQPVWRADRPQKARYREFYQCDADVIGSNSLLHEANLIQIIDKVFDELKIDDITIYINNRKILNAIATKINAEDKLIAMTTALDKIDKIGIDKVKEDMLSNGISSDSIELLSPVFDLSTKSILEQMDFLTSFLSGIEIGEAGIKELKTLYDYLSHTSIDPNKVKLDITLARGLNYYTGTILEVKCPDFPTLCSGGRYDDLTSIFGLKDISGVGISFGADRIYDLLMDRNLFPDFHSTENSFMFLNFSEEEMIECIPIAEKIRNLGYTTEIYPTSAKMKKQMKFANDKGIRYVVFYGEKERSENLLSLKDMITGEQSEIKIENLQEKFGEKELSKA